MAAAYGLVVMDLDGTLVPHRAHGGWGADMVIPPVLVKTLDDLQASGIPVVVATGRPVWAALPIVRQLPESDLLWLVASDGAYTHRLRDPSGATCLTLSPERAVAAISSLAASAEFAVEFGTEGYVHTPGFAQDFPSTFIRSADVSELAQIRTTRLIGRLTPASQESGESGEPGAHLEHARQALRELDGDGLRYTVFDNGWIDVVAAAATKESMAATIAAHHGVAAPRVLVAGDGDNDLGMIRWGGLSIAMAHAPLHVRDAAGHVAGSPEELAALLVELHQ
ncbi:HAD family hydrolase [Catenulispora pinisilvae]|uniref:HAD family hydrolase n=1 Tax=Catenulispora pinisilvae TaxID=2705253 RepID=UPI00189109E2|nr:HAD hydrolase family protein [Catenulispora pinisilvae]